MTDTMLRLCFNESQVLERAQAGQITWRLRKDKEMLPEKCAAMRFPFGTRVQIIEYADESGPLALAHQFVYPDATVGASGKPDPKFVICCGAQLIPMVPPRP
ncbi:MAG: hypothetical protein QM692_24710 [Thermomicrobiales bacterium]